MEGGCVSVRVSVSVSVRIRVRIGVRVGLGCSLHIAFEEWEVSGDQWPWVLFSMNISHKNEKWDNSTLQNHKKMRSLCKAQNTD